MGRLCLYNTPDEKLSAKRAKDNRYYEKNKKQIRRRSRRRYRKKAKEELKQKSSKPQETRPVELAPPEKLSEDPLTFIFESKIHFDYMTNGNLYDYVDLVVKACIDHPDLALEILEEQEKVWMEFILGLHKALDSVLQEFGCGEEWKGAELIAKDFRHVLALIKDVHSHALTSLDEMADWHESSIYGYQICREVKDS